MATAQTSLIALFVFFSLTAAVLADESMGQKLDRLLDTDKDGVISREEFMHHVGDEHVWEQLDSDEDGVLDLEEKRRILASRYRTVN